MRHTVIYWSQEWPAGDVEREHRRALSLGQAQPNAPWPKATTSAPPLFRAFAKEFLQYAKTHTKPGTHTFYDVALNRLLTFAGIADAPLDAITGETVSRYARHRQEVPGNSVVTVNGDLRTLRRVLHLAVEWGKLDRAPAIHELPQSKGRERVVSFQEEALYLAKASENLRDAAILAVDTGLRPNSELFPIPTAQSTSPTRAAPTGCWTSLLSHSSMTSQCQPNNSRSGT